MKRHEYKFDFEMPLGDTTIDLEVFMFYDVEDLEWAEAIQCDTLEFCILNDERQEITKTLYKEEYETYKQIESECRAHMYEHKSDSFEEIH